VQKTGLDWKVAVNTAGLTKLAEKAQKKILGVEVAKGLAGDLSASYKEGTTRKKMEAVKTSFQKTQAFSLGRGLPLESDPAQWMDNWVKQVDGEAMPFRYALKSVCEHPALVDKKADCEKYRNTYCSAWLKKNDESVSCVEPRQSQCTFQSDCPQGYKCEERECVKEPRCRAILSQYEGVKWSIKYRLVYYGEKNRGYLLEVACRVRCAGKDWFKLWLWWLLCALDSCSSRLRLSRPHQQVGGLQRQFQLQRGL